MDKKTIETVMSMCNMHIDMFASVRAPRIDNLIILYTPPSSL